MEMVRELNDKLKTMEPRIKDLESKSGTEFASRLRKMDIKIRDGVVLLSGDFSDAYSYCTFVDVSRAIVVVGRFVGLQESRVELMIELAWLILTNNYVSCAVDIFHLGTALPMGNSCSGKFSRVKNKFEVTKTIFLGELLDLICFSAEMKLYNKCLQYEEVEVIIEKGKVLKINSGESVEGRNKLSEAEENVVKEYSRYRDDTEAVLVSNNEELLRGVLQKICTIYPAQLVYNVTLSH